jgi:hypothetical protein
LKIVPEKDLAGIEVIILRQPKEKEEIFSNCWGRLIYDFSYNNGITPAIVIEAVDITKNIKIKKSDITPFIKNETEMLKSEGHEIVINNGNIVVKSSLDAVKKTQLYRTLPHEIGHYVYYKNGLDLDNYLQKETFANIYAEAICQML